MSIKRAIAKGIRLRRRGPIYDFDPVERAALLEQECPLIGTGFANEFAWYFHLELGLRIYEGTAKGKDAYERHRYVILPQWIAKRPGTRPTCWWRFEAPPHPGVNEKSPSEVQARFLQARGLLSREEAKRVPKEWLAPKQPQLTVVKGEINV